MKHTRGRLEYIDALRGLAALFVVAAHVIVPIMGVNLFFFHDVFDPGKLGVVWFFIISGMVIPYSLHPGKGALRRFGLSRFFRLYPAYWLSLVVFLLASMVAQHALPPVKQILLNTTMLQTLFHSPDVVGVYWTLFIELMFYGFCAVAFKAGLLQKLSFQEISALGFLLVALLMSLARGYLNMKLPVALPLGLSLMCFGSVWRFATIEQFNPARVAASRILIAYLIVLPFAFFHAYHRDMGFGETWTRYTITYAAAIVSFVILTTKIKIINRTAVWIGGISYSLYLLHPAVMTVAEWFMSRPVPVIVCTFAGSIAIAAVTYHYVERPMNALGKKLRRHIPSDSPAATDLAVSR